MNNSPKVSVIVPVYNAQRSLPKCVESILNQTVTDYELLLINDGSTDNSGMICDQYAKDDARIKVFHKPNGGVSSARNKGIDNALGRYICFIDSDDWVESEYLKSFFNDKTKNNQYIFVIQGICKEIEGENFKYCSFSDRRYDAADVSVLFDEYQLLRFGFPFSKLYNTEIIKINQIHFDEQIHFCEDLLFMLTYLQYVTCVYTISKSCYHYVCSSDNSLSKIYNSYESEYKLFVKVTKILGKLSARFDFNEDYRGYIKAFLGKFLMRVIQSLYRPMYRKNYFDRVVLLKSLLTKEHIECLIQFQNSNHNKIINSCSIFLLRYNLLYFFDFYFLLLFSLRYRYERYWVKYRYLFLRNSLIGNDL